MYHRRLNEMLDEMLEHPDDLFISSNSKRCALISMPNGSMTFLEGDFSGSPEENEAEARRILSQKTKPRRRATTR
jgi:hypothetical protein